jgi:hypothetical protein
VLSFEKMNIRTKPPTMGGIQSHSEGARTVGKGPNAGFFPVKGTRWVNLALEASPQKPRIGTQAKVLACKFDLKAADKTTWVNPYTDSCSQGLEQAWLFHRRGRRHEPEGQNRR